MTRVGESASSSPVVTVISHLGKTMIAIAADAVPIKVPVTVTPTNVAAIE